MATDDVQRLVVGTAPAPADFLIPGNGQMQPKTIFASFNGTGAAVPFKPALKIISDGGKTVGIYPTDISVAAGGSADVTWFPGLTGAASTGVVGALIAARAKKTVAQTIPNVTNTAVSWDTTDFDTGTPTPFWTNAHPTRMTAPVHGYYLLLTTLAWNFGGGFIRGTYLYKNGGANYFFEHGDAVQGGGNYNNLGQQMELWEMQQGDYFEIFAYQDSGGNLDLIALPPVENHYSIFSIILIATA